MSKDTQMLAAPQSRTAGKRPERGAFSDGNSGKQPRREPPGLALILRLQVLRQQSLDLVTLFRGEMPLYVVHILRQVRPCFAMRLEHEIVE